MMRNSGFMLIELLVALLISSLLGVLLFNAFIQTNRSMRTVDAITNFSSRSTTARYVMERDLAGAFIPTEGLKKKKKTEPAPKQPATAQPQAPKPAPEKKERKPITHIFYATNKDGMLSTLTFITNNPLRSPVAIARVVYRVVPEKSADKRKPSYALLRQEDTALDFKDYSQESGKNIKAHELLSGIKSIAVTYTAEISKERVEKKEKEEKKTTETEYKAVKEWNLEEQAAPEPGQPFQHPIPFAVHVEMVLWDEGKQRTRPASFKTVITPEMDPFELEPKKAAIEQPQQKQGAQMPSAQKQTIGMNSIDKTLSMFHRLFSADPQGAPMPHNGQPMMVHNAPQAPLIPGGGLR